MSDIADNSSADAVDMSAASDVADSASADVVDAAPLAARPLYAGETEISLAAATLTSSGCTSPALAIDDDPATAALLGPPGTTAGLGPLARPVSARRVVQASGASYAGVPASLLDGNAATTADLFLTGAFQADWFVLDLGAETTVGSVTLSNVTTSGNSFGVWVTDTPDQSPSQGDPGQMAPQFAFPLPPGSAVVFTGRASGRFLQIRQFELGAATGSLVIGEVAYQPVISVAMPRFVRVDWGFDAFISRIRLAFSGPGAGNAGVDYESSLSRDAGHSPPADIALSYIPVPADGTIHEVVFSPPVLGRGAVFYPDALLPGPSSQSVSLAQFQVYQDIATQGVSSVPNPTTNQARVGCSGAVITPRAYTSPTSYPFPQNAASVLRSIQGLSFSAAAKLARETGGETVHQINGYETDREMKCKISVQRHDYLALQNFLGGTLIVNPANPANGTQETQYHAPGYGDRAPYFSLVAQSVNGDPTALLVLPKCKIDGSLTADLERDKTTTLDVDFVLFWDYNYTRQDGTLGGIYETVFNNGGAAALHS